MKKLIAGILCLLMMSSLAACSGFSFENVLREEIQEAVREEIREEIREEVREEMEKEAVRGETREEAVGEEQILPEVSVEDRVTEDREKEFSMGKTENLVYENTFIGIGCTLEHNWSFYSDEEIMELNNYAAEAAGEEFEDLIQDADLIYDMFAISDNQLENINVNLEKVSNYTLDRLVLEDYLEQNIPLFLDGFSNMGYSNLHAGLDTIRIEGTDMSCLSTSGEINGLTMYQKLFSVKCNGYLATITITTYEENTVDLLAERLYFVE